MPTPEAHSLPGHHPSSGGSRGSDWLRFCFSTVTCDIWRSWFSRQLRPPKKGHPHSFHAFERESYKPSFGGAMLAIIFLNGSIKPNRDGLPLRSMDGPKYLGRSWLPVCNIYWSPFGVISIDQYLGNPLVIIIFADKIAIWCQFSDKFSDTSIFMWRGSHFTAVFASGVRTLNRDITWCSGRSRDAAGWWWCGSGHRILWQKQRAWSSLLVWLPSGKHTKSYWKLPSIVSFPIKNCDFP